MNAVINTIVSTIWAFQVLLVYLTQIFQDLIEYPLHYGYRYRDVVGTFSIEILVQNYFVEISVGMTVEFHSLET